MFTVMNFFVFHIPQASFSWLEIIFENKFYFFKSKVEFSYFSWFIYLLLLHKTAGYFVLGWMFIFKLTIMKPANMWNAWNKGFF